MVAIVTTTCLGEEERELVINSLTMLYPGNIEYSGDLNSKVNILVLNPTSDDKSWVKSHKFQHVVQYRPDILVVSLESILLLVRGKKKLGFEVPMVFDLPVIKPFAGLKFSISRLEEDVSHKVRTMLESNGGNVSTSLTSDTDLMIAMYAEGKRYQTALEWKIPVVSPDWCYDSVERGLFLNPRYYFLTQNFTDLVKKFQGEGDNITESMVKVYKMGNRSEACDWDRLKDWNNSRKKFNIEERVRSKMKLHGSNNESETKKDLKRNRRLFEETEDNSDDENTHNREIEERTVNIKRSIVGKRGLQTYTARKSITNSFLAHEPQERKLIKKESDQMLPLFHQMTFKVLGFSDVEKYKLEQILNKFGGRITQTSEEPVHYTIVSYKNNQLPAIENCITDLAIQRFLFHNKLLDDNYLWLKPFRVDESTTLTSVRNTFGLSESTEKIRVCLTGFQGTDMAHLELLLKERFVDFFDYEVNFDKTCEILVLNSENKQITNSLHTRKKLELSKKWKVKCLSAEHFFNSIVSK